MKKKEKEREKSSSINRYSGTNNLAKKQLNQNQLSQLANGCLQAD